MILPMKDRGGRQASDPLTLMPAVDYAGNDHLPACLREIKHGRKIKNEAEQV